LIRGSSRGRGRTSRGFLLKTLVHTATSNTDNCMRLTRRWVHQLTADWPLWQALNAALREDGWKLVALLRVSPATPFSAVSYALGTSSLSVSGWGSVWVRRGQGGGQLGACGCGWAG
jgi:hypothetical protein